MNILCNAFSVNMLSGDALVRFERVTEKQFQFQLGSGTFTNAIGHAATAALLTSRLDLQVEANRVEVSIEPGTLLYVAQVKGRLPEGHVLSEEEIQAVKIDYWLVSQEQ